LTTILKWEKKNGIYLKNQLPLEKKFYSSLKNSDKKPRPLEVTYMWKISLKNQGINSKKGFENIFRSIGFSKISTQTAGY